MKVWLNSDKISDFELTEKLTHRKLCAEAGIKYNTFAAQYYHQNQATLQIALPLAMLMECSVEDIIKVDWEA